MEVLSEKNSLKCIKHPNEQSTFIKINQINISDKILYCETCIEEDFTFTSLNFLRIKKILDSNSFLQQWPPLDDSKIHEQILQIQSDVENDKNLENKIIKFFDEFRNEIMLKVNNCQKSVIKLATEISQEKKNILQKFKEISNIDNLKSILRNNSINEGERENQLKQFIQSAMDKKEQNKQQIMKVLNQNNYQNRQFSFEMPQAKKLEILTLIENLNFFGLKCNNEQQALDLIKPINEKDKIENILPKLNIIESLINNHVSNEIKISSPQNDQIEINLEYGKKRLYSNIILEQNKKYILRYQLNITSFQDQVFCFGLINDQYKDIALEEGSHVCQYIYLNKSSKQMTVCKGHFSQKQKKLDDVKDIELRIDLQNQTVEINFPNNNIKLCLQDEFKKYLNSDSYRLYLLLKEQISITIESALICDKFED